ncbi:hypothetical protein T12_4268 [Trichinella patagoniensis]|uniref:Uncharacterized protein n=1 Tax=Trichinella patagoniensis TaxID=990121 RepID=A0A0V0ULY6_9BILA|nr:hypothetical protein T12_4268 [Trichinella patagoniensis]
MRHQDPFSIWPLLPNKRSMETIFPQHIQRDHADIV